MVLIKYIGGSRLHGIHTETSDVDWRGVFIEDDLSKIIGLSSVNSHIINNPTKHKDIILRELRHWLGLVRQGNIEATIALFVPVSGPNKAPTTEANDYWHNIQAHTYELVDSERLYISIDGQSNYYIRLIGQYEQTEDPQVFAKSLSTVILLYFMGKLFFTEKILPTNLDQYPEILSLLKDVRTDPHRYFRIWNEVIIGFKNQFYYAYSKNDFNCKFNLKVANKICLHAYLPILQQLAK